MTRLEFNICMQSFSMLPATAFPWGFGGTSSESREVAALPRPRVCQFRKTRSLFLWRISMLKDVDRNAAEEQVAANSNLDIAVILPTFNERENVPEAISRLAGILIGVE
jgi:hypothetical protein